MAVLLTVSCVSSERKEARVLYEKASQEYDGGKRKIYFKEMADKYPNTEYSKYSKIGDLVEAGKFDEAEKLSNDLIKEYPDFEGGYYWLGSIKANKKEYSDAIQLYDKALTSEIAPNFKKTHYYRALVYYIRMTLQCKIIRKLKKV